MSNEETLFISFKTLEYINLEMEGGNEFTLFFKKNNARTYRIEYFLNGQFLTRRFYPSSRTAKEAWQSIIKEVRKQPEKTEV